MVNSGKIIPNIQVRLMLIVWKLLLWLFLKTKWSQWDCVILQKFLDLISLLQESFHQKWRLYLSHRNTFEEKLRERRGPQLTLDKGITECRKVEFNKCLVGYFISCLWFHQSSWHNIANEIGPQDPNWLSHARDCETLPWRTSHSLSRDNDCKSGKMGGISSRH